MRAHGLREPRLARGPGRIDRGHDAATGRVQLLVGRAAGTHRELLHAVAGEARMRVAVDEPGHGAEAARVELLDLAVDSPQVAHAPDRLDSAVAAQDIRILEHLDVAESGAAERRTSPAWGRQLHEIADEQAATAARRAHSVTERAIGATRPCASAAAAASG